MGRLLFGTSSWSEKAWDGVFYPAGLPAGDRLSHYATQLATVEADVTYYRVPSPAMVSAWQRKTPDGFVLSAKFPRSIVHGGEKAAPDPSRLLLWDAVGADVDRFLGAMAALGPKCGPLVLQFPYFNRQAFPAPGPFLERLDAFLERLPPDRRYAVELRNKTWLKKPVLDILRRHRTALVLVDLPYMPHAADLDLDPLTTDFTYLRLIGDRKDTEARADKFDRIAVDHGDRLERWATWLRDVLSRVPLAYAYANNHFAGFAPETIRDLARRLGSL
ncbi:MAG: DUF72 domain-containing protein [Deltaproteobacteria bacterium]|nr:DUF72 domain-containing protein [Deltaproteobacteria bacterium]